MNVTGDPHTPLPLRPSAADRDRIARVLRHRTLEERMRPAPSRHHGELRRDADRWLLRDLGSRNGTRVNGMRVVEATEVHPGDRIDLGEARFRLLAPR